MKRHSEIMRMSLKTTNVQKKDNEIKKFNINEYMEKMKNEEKKKNQINVPKEDTEIKKFDINEYMDKMKDGQKSKYQTNVIKEDTEIKKFNIEEYMNKMKEKENIKFHHEEFLKDPPKKISIEEYLKKLNNSNKKITVIRRKTPKKIDTKKFIDDMIINNENILKRNSVEIDEDSFENLNIRNRSSTVTERLSTIEIENSKIEEEKKMIEEEKKKREEERKKREEERIKRAEERKKREEEKRKREEEEERIKREEEKKKREEEKKKREEERKKREEERKKREEERKKREEEEKIQNEKNRLKFEELINNIKDKEERRKEEEKRRKEEEERRKEELERRRNEEEEERRRREEERKKEEEEERKREEERRKEEEEERKIEEEERRREEEEERKRKEEERKREEEEEKEIEKIKKELLEKKKKKEEELSEIEKEKLYESARYEKAIKDYINKREIEATEEREGKNIKFTFEEINQISTSSLKYLEVTSTGKLITLSSGSLSKITIYSENTYQEENCIILESKVNTFIVDNNYIYCALDEENDNILILSLNNFDDKSYLNCHNCSVNDLTLTKSGYLISADIKGNIIAWKNNKIEKQVNDFHSCIDTIRETKESTQGIAILSFNEETVRFYELRYSSLVSIETIKNIKGSGLKNNMLKLSENILAISGTYIYIIDLNSLSLTNIINCLYANDSISDFHFNNRGYFFVSQALTHLWTDELEKGTLGYYQYNYNSELFINENTLVKLASKNKCHDSYITSIKQIDSKTIVTGSYDGKIKFWILKDLD